MDQEIYLFSAILFVFFFFLLDLSLLYISTRHFWLARTIFSVFVAATNVGVRVNRSFFLDGIWCGRNVNSKYENICISNVRLSRRDEHMIFVLPYMTLSVSDSFVAGSPPKSLVITLLFSSFSPSSRYERWRGP